MKLIDIFKLVLLILAMNKGVRIDRMVIVHFSKFFVFFTIKSFNEY